MKLKDEQSNEVAVKQEAGAIAAVKIEQFGEAGFENVDSKSLALPFLKVLGQLSPQVTQGDSQFIPEARAGMIYNTVTDELYDGQKGISVIPCYYKLEYQEWADFGTGSGRPENIFDANSDILSKTKNENGKDRLENGHYIQTVGQHYVLIRDGNSTENALISMSSSQGKVSRKWNSMMMSITLD